MKAPRSTKLLVLALTATLAGCLDDSSSSNNDDRRTGQFTLTGVEGVSYQTQSQSGTTDEDGSFRYYPGETISFAVGDLPIIEDVPVAPFLTSMDFTAEQRERLSIGGTDDEGFTSHRVIEEQIASQEPIAVNIMRLLMTLDQDSNASADNNIEITQRTIDQINSYLAEHGDELDIDFSQPISEFAMAAGQPLTDSREVSDINRVLDSICFEEEGDPLCDPLPTQEEIDNATDEEREELVNKRQAIIDARRDLQDVEVVQVTDFLLEQAMLYKTQVERPFFLRPDAITLHPDDNSLYRIELNKAGSGFMLPKTGLEAEVEGEALVLHSFNAETATVEFFADGQDGDTGTVLVNFRVQGDDHDRYRWFRKNVRVCLSDDGRPCSTEG